MKLRLSILAAALAIVSCGGGDFRNTRRPGCWAFPRQPSSARTWCSPPRRSTAARRPNPPSSACSSTAARRWCSSIPSFFGLPAPATANDVQTHVDLGLLERTAAPVVTIKQDSRAATVGRDDGRDRVRRNPGRQRHARLLDPAGLRGADDGGLLPRVHSQPRDDVESPGTVVPFTLAGGGRGPVPLHQHRPTDACRSRRRASPSPSTSTGRRTRSSWTPAPARCRCATRSSTP